MSRLDDIAALQDGWLDGEGKAISMAALSKADELLNPHLFPTPEGGVSIETDDYDVIVAPDGTVWVVGEYADNPSDDATDAAHPAWWRGHDYGSTRTAETLLRVAKEGRSGGKFGGAVEEAALEIERLRAKNREFEQECVAYRAQLEGRLR